MLNAAKWPTAALIACIGTFASQDSGTKPPPPPPAAPPLFLALTSVTPDAVITSGAGDRRIAVTPDGVWVSNRQAGTLTRIDPKTHAPGRPVAVGKQPCYSVLSAFKSVWTPLCGAPGLARLDAAGSAAKPPAVISIGVRKPGPIVSGTASIWMITDDGTLARIDPDTNAIVAEVTVPSGVESMAFGDAAVWIASASGNTLTRVSGHTNVVVDTIKVGRTPSAVAVGDGAVWTLNSGDGTVSRVDPRTNKVTTTIKTGVTGRGGSIAVGEGSVWLSAPGAPLTRLDPLTNRMSQQFSGPGGGALAFGLTSLWLAATPTEIWRIDPKRVEATRK